MSTQSTCPDCGGKKYRYATFCKKCASKGERNPRFGKKFSPETLEKMRESARNRPRGTRKRRSTTDNAGRAIARWWFPMPDLCERCHVAKPIDRHHQDGNPQNNAPENVLCVCRRCHQELDGRIEMLRNMAAEKAKVTHCKRGHPLNERRVCRVCQREAEKRYRERKVEMAKRLLVEDSPLFNQVEA